MAFFNADDSKSDLQRTREFRRTVTNVGRGQSTYAASVTPLKGLVVQVVPDKLEFNEAGEKLSFVLSIKGPRRIKEQVVFGYLTWEEGSGGHVVRSPVVATHLSSEIVSSHS